ncbi:hypothetical protein CR513_15156, partial [Mucuna pruriens]
MLKQLYVNIRFVKALQQMPTYAKFLKDIPSIRRKLVYKKLYGKLKDLGSFCIPYLIENIKFDRCLCDHGARVSLMPLFMCNKLDMGKLKPTTMSI